MKHYVEVSDQALVQIVMNSLEAFVVLHKGRKRSGIEMHGVLVGYKDEHEEDTQTSKQYKIDFFSPDTSAVMMPDHCIPQAESESLKNEVARCFSDFEVIGAFHTHPYLYTEIKQDDKLDFMRKEGCHFSDEDMDFFTAKLLNNSQEDENYQLEGVLAVFNSKKYNDKRDGRLEDEDNVFEFSVGNLKCFLRMQVFSLDEEGAIQEEETILKCSCLEKFKYIGKSFFDFGRIKVKDNKKVILEHKV